MTTGFTGDDLELFFFQSDAEGVSPSGVEPLLESPTLYLARDGLHLVEGLIYPRTSAQVWRVRDSGADLVAVLDVEDVAPDASDAVYAVSADGGVVAASPFILPPCIACLDAPTAIVWTRGPGGEYRREVLDSGGIAAGVGTLLPSIAVDDTGRRIAWVAPTASDGSSTTLFIAERRDAVFDTVWQWSVPESTVCPEGSQSLQDLALSPDGTRLALTVATVCDPTPAPAGLVAVTINRYIMD